MGGYESSFRRAIANGEYDTVIAYLNTHGADEYGEVIFKYSVARRAHPVVRELVSMGFDFLLVDDAVIDDDMADVVFGDPDKAVDSLTESSPEPLARFLVARQMEYHLEPTALMFDAKPFLKPYYLMAMV